MAESKAAAQPARKKVTIPMLVEKMKKGEPIVQLAVYDYETAIIADRVGIDILCVSDTGGMVLFGHETTTSVSFEEVMFMAQAVKRGSKYGLRMVDMPYMSFHLSAQQAVDNAAKYVAQGGAEVMKCEGNQHHAKDGLRSQVDAIRAGVIGNIKEVHVWTDRPIWPQGMTSRPAGEPTPPAHVNWDAWLGPAPTKNYDPAIHPFKWRGWWDYGTGALGDMGCHIMDMRTGRSG